jgi:diguanylate cyclase (GGDEF)-like protein
MSPPRPPPADVPSGPLAALRRIGEGLRAPPGPEDVASVVRGANAGAVVTALSASVYLAAASPALDPARLTVWYAFALVACAVVILRARRAARARPETVSPRAARELAAFAALLAAPWAGLAFLALGAGAPADRLLALMICAGMAAGGAFMLHRTLAAAAVYFAVVLGGVLAACLALAAAPGWPAALYAALYGLFLTHFAEVAGRAARQRDASLADLSRHVEELRRANDRIARLVLRDEVTGLANRKAFADRLEQETRRAERDGAPFAVLILDLDLFKNVNDTLGHQAGDRLLALIGARLGELVRPGDLVARLGGDEFGVLALGVGDGRALKALAGRLISGLGAPARLGGRPLHPGVSVGAALSPRHGRDAAGLLRRADIALNEVKASGRGRWRLFDDTLGARVAEADEIETGLRAALEGDGIEVRYQPKIDLATDAPAGAEALVRWTHPRLGAVAPDRFLPVAAERGLLPRLSERIFDRVARDMLDWRAAGIAAGPVAINIHEIDLKSPVILMDNLKALTRRGLAPEDIVLEITEGCFAGRGTGAAAVVLEGLADFGFQLSLDDFGAGHASLPHLRRLPVAEIKIDRSFVEGLCTDRNDRAIVEATAALARGMGLRCVAEGVETEEQRRALRALGAGQGQGYLWSPALPPADFRAFLEARAAASAEAAAGTGRGPGG